MGQPDPKRIILYLLLFAGVLYFAANLPFGSQTFPDFIRDTLVSTPGLVIVALLFLGLITWLKEDAWLVIPFALINPIPLGFLPFRFQWIEIAALVLMGYFFVVHLAMHHRTLDLGPRRFWMPLAVIACIIIYHQRQLGLGIALLGSSGSGGRRHIAILIGIGFFVAMMSLKPRKWDTFRKLPGFWLAWNLFKTVPTIFSYYFPEVAVQLGIFYFFVDLSYAREFFGGEVGRIGAWGELALALQLWLVSRFPIHTWFRLPRLEESYRLLVPLGSLAALLACGYGGFRGTLFHFGVVTMVAAVMALRWKVLLFAVPSLMVVALLVAGQGRLFELPLAVQRTFSFLPGGKWSSVVVLSAESSNDFRGQIQRIYMDSYMDRHPWLGDGYKVDARSLLLDFDRRLLRGVGFFEGFINNKDFHIGWISLYDCVGIVGSAAFLFLAFGMGWLMWKDSKRIGWDRLEPVQIWVICLFASNISAFWMVFGAMFIMMPLISFMAAVTWIVFREMPQSVPSRKPEALRVPRTERLPQRLTPEPA